MRSAGPALRALGRVATSRAARVAFFAVAVTLGVVAVVAQRSALATGLRDVEPAALAACLLLVVAALAATVAVFWVLLADLGSRLTFGAAARVVLVGALGKYVPGSVWAVVGPVEVARALGVPRRRTAVATLLQIVVVLAAGLLVAAVLLPLSAGEVARRYVWVLALLPLAGVALHPRVANPVVDRVLRLARRPPLEHPLRWRGVALAVGAALVCWLLYGLSVAVLIPRTSTAEVLAAATGGFALAWVSGLLVVVAPAGAGVREAVLVLALSPAVGAGPALLVALVHRAVLTLAELLVAAAVAAATRRLPAAPAPG